MTTPEEELAHCLKECGVRPQAREQILACAQEGDAERQLRLLGRQRQTLLEDLHRAQRRLDLMDLLIDSLKRAAEKPRPVKKRLT